jgi:triacylglycerol lipase
MYRSWNSEIPHPELMKPIDRVSPTKHPLVLCHGMGGDKWKLIYFQKIPEDLVSFGCKVFLFKVPRYGTVFERAKCLRDQIFLLSHQYPQFKKFNLIAHSMGGLDAREFISNLEGHRLTASLTTLSSPHRGSTSADLFVKAVSAPLQLQNIGIAAHHFVTTKFVRETFNPKTQDHPDVTYFSLGGNREIDSKLHPLYIPQKILSRFEGQNDGLVSVESSKWGEFLGCLPLDHAEMINWSKRYDARILFRDLTNFLHERGF